MAPPKSNFAMFELKIKSSKLLRMLCKYRAPP